MEAYPINKPITLEDIEDLAAQARAGLASVAEVMLAPKGEKTPPTFTTAKLGELVGMTPQKIDYRAKKNGDLPAGTLNASGSRRTFSLQEARTWARNLRKGKFRPTLLNGALLDASVITLANFKGGSTKTTTSVNLAQALSLRGHRVLFIDMDPQGSATTLFGVSPHTQVGDMETVLALCVEPDHESAQASIEYAVRKTYWDGIDLVPANTQLYGAEFMLPGRQMREPQFEFWRVIENALQQARKDYDIIIIDTSPSLSYLTINAMAAADGIIMPCPPENLDFASSVEFWGLFLDLAHSLGKYRSSKTYDFLQVVLSKVANTSGANAVSDWMRKSYAPYVCPVEIPHSSTASNAAAEFGSVYDLQVTSANSKTIKRAMDAYEGLADTIEADINRAWARKLQAATPKVA